MPASDSCPFLKETVRIRYSILLQSVCLFGHNKAGERKYDVKARIEPLHRITVFLFVSVLAYPYTILSLYKI